MSEYQYYEFQAIDRPLDRAAQEALRSISSRARITATSFTNHYDWGDFRGNPRNLMEQWFDLHLYLANWGTRRLMMRVPERFLKRADLDPFLREVDWVKIWTSGDSLILDINHDEEEPFDAWDDGSGWLATLAQLRADVLSGDLRLFYLLWLAAVQYELVSDGELEPLPGIGPLTGPLEAFAEFFVMDRNLVEAAAESGASDAEISKHDLREALAAIPEEEKTELLVRLLQGDSHVGAELKSRLRNERPVPSAPRRTVSELRMRAQEIREARERAEAERQEAERRRQLEEAEKARRVRLKVLKQRGAGIWREIEEEIERRNAPGYDKAASLLSDLQLLAAEEGSQGEFDRRLASICARHGNKWKFMERLIKLGLALAEE
ncbi:hypothetical protein SAZ10_23665 [Mesorhizobium sp. BAC0120]|uniref:hypothetical protein n=1 Tax=Mesorhizobium sp. BAC0120 TaxID=3090670 RepID=UPI00298C233A|nr:hypothetical protein [Mesorhizobium sp. BAC0120]MDW6024757.1 hypothetical protein [Mesorhizobium sp. BAC0120]